MNKPGITELAIRNYVVDVEVGDGNISFLFCYQPLVILANCDWSPELLPKTPVF